jgi:hypothetical protein
MNEIRFKGMKLIKEIEQAKEVWFCNCPIQDGSSPPSFGSNDGHEERINYSKFQKEYFCHIFKVVLIEKYKIIEKE